MRSCRFVAVVAAVLVAGCAQRPLARVNAPPHGTQTEHHPMADLYTHMTDNALLEDMSVSDMHFLPHRAQLSPLGEQRLERLAALISAFGGQVRYSTDSQDEQLVARRLREIKRFLGEAGVDTTGAIVVLDHPGGAGMMATEAVLIKKEEGTYKPRRSGGQGSGERGDRAGSGDRPLGP